MERETSQMSLGAKSPLGYGQALAQEHSQCKTSALPMTLLSYLANTILCIPTTRVSALLQAGIGQRGSLPF